MSSFKRFEIRKRALKRWKVVRSAVLADKHERAERRKAGNTEWLEEWKERKKTEIACNNRDTTELLLKLRLYFRDFKDEFRSLCELYVPSEMTKKSDNAEIVRYLKRQHLYAIFANCSLEPTRYESRKIIEHVLSLEPEPSKFIKKVGGHQQQEDALKAAKNVLLDENLDEETRKKAAATVKTAATSNSKNDSNEKSLTVNKFIFLVCSWLRLRGHRTQKENDKESENNIRTAVTGDWVSLKSARTGKERFTWLKSTNANAIKRKSAKGGAKEGAAEEVMEKIRKLASKRKGMDMKGAFKKFDTNQDGTIDPTELDKVLKSFGVELNDMELDAVFSRFDPDGGGSIDYAEFSYTFYNRRAIAKAAMSGNTIGKSGSSVPHSIDKPRSIRESASVPNVKIGDNNNDNNDNEMNGSLSTSTLVPTVKLATQSEMMASKIIRALTRKGAPLKTMDSARREEYADRAIRAISKASMKQKNFNLKGAFQKFDIDGNGTVDKVEFVSIMQGFDKTITEIEALAAFDRFDPSGDGEIDFDEFSYTFYNRRTFSESTKKIKKRRALGVTQRRKAAEKKNELLIKIESFFHTPICREIFNEFSDKQTKTLDLAGLNASLSQLPLDLNRDEVSLMLNTLNEGLHHAVTFDEFKNIIKLRRRNMSACRQSIDENKGSHRKLPKCTSFRAPVLKENDESAMAAVKAAQAAQKRQRQRKLTPIKMKPSLSLPSTVEEDEKEGGNLGVENGIEPQHDEIETDEKSNLKSNIMQLPPLEVDKAAAITQALQAAEM
jgi:Ca2+-binding EF-hand superfamily protein